MARDKHEALEHYRRVLPDAKRYQWLRGNMWWRTDPFAQDVGNVRTGYWQTKLFKKVDDVINLDVIIDAAIAYDEMSK